MFTAADYLQMESLGISRRKALSQIEVFHRSSFHARLKRACVQGEGVQKISPTEVERYLRLHLKASRAGRFQKFIPASGAATRMFQSLLQIFYLPQYLEHDELYRRAEYGVTVATDFLRFLEGLYDFPFLDDLKQVIAKDSHSFDHLLCQYRYREILDYLLTDRGLNYASLPKALLKFHRYSSECRTALEEHLIEGSRYLGNGGSTCNMHFTISARHESGFRELLERVRKPYEKRCGTNFNICFSFQKPSTNTIAVNMQNNPFRDKSGRLHFRPGGHGALLENLNDLGADIVYIKNIDNVSPDHLKEDVVLWKKILGGYLIDIQKRVHDSIRKLKGDLYRPAMDKTVPFARERLFIDFPASFDLWPAEKKRDFLIGKLNRPIRVCGVVPNSGEPGGAPFWVEGKDGSLSLQIVERAQVDFSSLEQADIWNASTHFNPVDIVCALKDFEGKPFDLRKYVDEDAVFISRKSKDGQDIKALELPGLWNGGMADWITVIVEVPRITFNPVKTVFDLLRPEHQPLCREFGSDFRAAVAAF